MEAMATFTNVMGRLIRTKEIPHRGKHLDRFEWTDLAFLTFNKVSKRHARS